MKALTKRTMAPKKKAEKEPEESQTKICVGPESVAPKDDTARCAECNNRVWRGGFCFHHWRLSLGYKFDEDKKVYVAPKGKK